MSRRIAVIALALASLALGAYAQPTAPRVSTDSACGVVTNGSHTRC